MRQGLLRQAALVTAAAGAAGSAVLVFREGQRTPPLLLVVMAGWVVAPFVALVWAIIVSRRWPASVLSTLFGLTVVSTLVSLAIYARLIHVGPREAPNAFPFVIVAPIVFLIIAIALPLTIRASRKPER